MRVRLLVVREHNVALAVPFKCGWTTCFRQFTAASKIFLDEYKGPHPVVAFMRPVLSRAISTYQFFKSRGAFSGITTFYANMLRTGLIDPHTHSQVDSLSVEGRFRPDEIIVWDWETLGNRLGVFTWDRANPSTPLTYTDDELERLRELLEQLYPEDIKMAGYDEVKS